MTEPEICVSFSFLHAADCHLGSPLGGLAARDGALAHLFDRAVWKAFETMVDLAIDERVAFVLLAGDVFDRDWRDYATGQSFVRTIARLPRAGIRVVMIRGNHDADSLVSRRLPLPDGVVWLGADAPETVDWPELGVAIHGMSFPAAEVKEAIVDRYPPARPGRFNVGLLHTALDGRPDVARYAPASLADLERLGYDYWALGHVHVREVVKPLSPAVVFPGNIQGRSIRETGEKSVTLVEVDGGAIRLRSVPVDHARFALVEVDATGAADRDAVLARIRDAARPSMVDAGGRPLAVRIRISGRCPFADSIAGNRDVFRQEAQAALAALDDRIMVEKVVTAFSPDGTPVLGLPGVDLDEVLAEVLADPALAAGVAADTAALVSKLKLPDGAAALVADEAEVLSAAAALVRTRLAETSG